MYQCNMCKRDKSGLPAMKNNCGIFCEDCKAEISRKMIEAVKEKQANWNGLCEYCGKPITQNDPSSFMIRNSGGKYVHESCERKRDWMLDCIRYSGRLAQYVAKTEAKESDAREMRAAEMAKAKITSIQQFVETPDKRIDRLEKLVEKLTAALGGI